MLFGVLFSLLLFEQTLKNKPPAPDGHALQNASFCSILLLRHTSGGAQVQSANIGSAWNTNASLCTTRQTNKTENLRVVSAHVLACSSRTRGFSFKTACGVGTNTY